MKTLIFGIFLLITYANCDPPKFEEPAPADFIAGAYQLKRRDYTDALQNPASVWPFLRSDFTVNVDPLKYCHAIYICPFFQKAITDKVFFHAKKDMCDVDGSIRYYPWKNELVYKENGEYKKVAYQRHKLFFKYSNKNGEYSLKHSTKDPIYNKKLYDQAPSDDIPFHFKVKYTGSDGAETEQMSNFLLILTNSRACRASVSYPEKEMMVYHVMDRNMDPQKDDSENMDYLSLPETGKSEKKVDLLPFIELNDDNKKAVDVRGSRVKRVKSLKCYARRMNEMTSLEPSVLTYSVTRDQATSDGTTTLEHVLYLTVQNCDWVRLWITKKDTDINTYKTSLELKNTLDLFMYQSFAVLPDTDIARPLQLDNLLYERFVLKMDSELIKLSYGLSGTSYRYAEFFKNDIMAKEVEYDIHIIRPPLCYAALAPQFGQYASKRTLDTKVANMLDINCKYQVITNA